MRRKAAMLVSGIITAFVMVVVIGLLQLSGRVGNTAQAAALPSTGPAQATVNGADPTNADVATLQAEVAAYRDQLQQAYTALQQAYQQIQLLSGGGGGSGGNGFRGRGGDDDGQFPPGLTQPFNQQQPQPFGGTNE